MYRPARVDGGRLAIRWCMGGAEACVEGGAGVQFARVVQAQAKGGEEGRGDRGCRGESDGGRGR